MSTIQQIRQWGTTHHPRWLVVLRVGLGICLFFKGITFMSNTALLDKILSGSPWAGNAPALAIIITWANLLSGFLLAVGLMTRVVALLQIPILIGAIIFINAQLSGFAAQSELGLALLVLLLDILFLIEGSGPLSLDGYFSKNRGRESQGREMP
jgi:putative oxidoreductase